MQIAQDDDGGFEIASFGGSLDDEEETRTPEPNGQSYGEGGIRAKATIPPTPAPKVTRQERHSLDGETIFAVGEDGDKWSDDENADSPRNSHERKGSTS